MAKEPAAEALEALQHAVQRWREHPDGAHFQELARRLQGAVEATITGAMSDRKQAVFLAPLPGSVSPLRVQVSLSRDGSRHIPAHSYIRDFDDVVQEFLLRTLERFLENPSFEIRHPAYIRMGLAWRAYALERAAVREDERNRNFGESANLFSERPGIAERSAGGPNDLWTQQEGFLDFLQAIWFYPAPHPYAHRLPVEAPALSLRYLYATLRIHSGVGMQTIARELGIHGSRLSATKKELGSLLGAIAAGSWLPLGDILPLRISQPVMEKLDLTGPLVRYSSLRWSKNVAGWKRVQRHKEVLWNAYLKARESLAGYSSRPVCEWTSRLMRRDDNTPFATLAYKQSDRGLELFQVTF